MILTTSKRPPKPTSSTQTSQSAVANIKSAAKVVISKKDKVNPHCSLAASTCSKAAIKVLSLTIWPLIRTRSLNSIDIGREKAGILREGIPLIYGATEMPASVAELVEQHNVTCYQVGQDFYYREVKSSSEDKINTKLNNELNNELNTNAKPTWQYSNAAVTLQLITKILARA